MRAICANVGIFALALAAAGCAGDDSTESAASASTGLTSVGASTSATAGSTGDGTTGEDTTTTAGSSSTSAAASTDPATGDPSTSAASSTDATSTSDASTSEPTTGDASTGPDTTTGALIEEVLLDLPGDAYTPTDADTMERWDFGVDGTAYVRVTVRFDLVAGGWQPEIPDEGDPDRTEHILFGLFRAHQQKSDQRYLMGTAAVNFAGSKKPHFRMFGRIELAAGYMSYTQWSGTYLWQEGGDYHVECVLDGELHQQRCVLSLDGQEVAERVGAVDYLDPAAHLSSGFYLELGREPPGDIETSPIGWIYRNVQVIGAHY